MRRASLIVIALAFAGCNNDGNPTPPDAWQQDGGARDAFVVSDSGRDTSVTDTGSVDGGVDANADAQASDASTVDANTADAFDCHDPTGCYRCPPTTPPQFLNHCTAPGVTCEAFPVTVARLPHLNADGTLPALP